MSDEDWRVRVELDDEGVAGRLHGRAGAIDVERHARRELGDRAVLSRDGNVLFAYATTREGAESAASALRALCASEGVEAKLSLTRWHPARAEWEDADLPLESGPDAQAQAHAEEERDEEQEGKASGVPEFEVKITFPSRGDAIEFAERLDSEGIPTARHWHHLLVGAWTEDDANLLADRIRAEAPPGTEVATDMTLAYLVHHGSPGSYGPFVPF
jgi:hypothetical protein